MPRPVRLSVCPLLLADTYQLSLTDPRATEPSFRQSLMVAVINYTEVEESTLIFGDNRIPSNTV